MRATVPQVGQENIRPSLTAQPRVTMAAGKHKSTSLHVVLIRSRPNWITGPAPKLGSAGKSESHGPENGVSRWRRPNKSLVQNFYNIVFNSYANFREKLSKASTARPQKPKPSWILKQIFQDGGHRTCTRTLGGKHTRKSASFWRRKHVQYFLIKFAKYLMLEACLL